MIVARGDDFADALVASHLASALNGGAPILLTPKDHLAPAVLRQVQRLQTRRVFLMGDREVISQQVEDELAAAGPEVIRVAGRDRFDTARQAAAFAPDSHNVAYLASGRSFADALAAGPVAYASDWHVLLTEPDHLPEAVRQTIPERGIWEIIILGGTSAVSAQVENDLRNLCWEVATGTRCLDVKRVAGNDRYATAIGILDDVTARSQGTIRRITLARGDTFPDAVAAAPLGGELDSGTVFTVGPNELGATSRAWIQAHASTIDTVYVLGDAEAISDAVVNEVDAILSAS